MAAAQGGRSGEPSPAACAGRCTACRSASRTSSTSRACPRPAIPRSSTDNIAEADAVCVQKLRGAGAIVMGKLSTHEFAIGGPSFDLPWPPARNPVEHRPSSRRLVVGLGLGRRRRPVPDGAGHRHRRQRAQSRELLRHRRAEADLRPGVAPRRLSAVLHARPYRADDAHRRGQRADAARRSPATIRSIPAAPPSRDRPLCRQRSIAACAICASASCAISTRSTRRPSPRSRRRSSMSRARLQMEGAEVRDIRLPTLTEFGAVNRVILQSEAWAIHGPWLRERPGDYGQLARRRLMAGAFMNAGDYVQAQRRRLEMIAEVEAAFREVDVLLCASSMDPPCRIDRPADDRAHLSAPGAHAVQRHRPSGAGHDGRAVGRRPAAVGAVRRPLLRGKRRCSRWRAPGSTRRARTRSTRRSCE